MALSLSGQIMMGKPGEAAITVKDTTNFSADNIVYKGGVVPLGERTEEEVSRQTGSISLTK